MNVDAEAEQPSQIQHLIEVGFQQATSIRPDEPQKEEEVSQSEDKEVVVGIIESTIMSTAKSHLDGALPELVRELGYSFTSNKDACRAYLRQWVGGPDIHAAAVARIIGVMVRTHTGLDDSATLQSMNATGTSLWDKDKANEPKTWDVAVFIKAVHELQPTLHWKEIIYELDHPGFAIKDRLGLILLINALKQGFQVQGFQGPFPVDMFYRPWKSTDGQLSLFQQILLNPDVFNFADFHHHPVAVEVLKVPPDLENREVAPWRSLELIDTLLVLAEAGHVHVVKDMFCFPQQNCLDVLTLGLMQINPPMTTFRTELLASNLQQFLANHPNSGVILQHAWHSSTINLKVIVVHAMADWYSKAASEGDKEHNRLSRILDVAQDLKALSVLLATKAVPFVIDLAVLAARRGCLNLDKWLTDQMREHGGPFVKAVVQYLRRKLPNLSSPGIGLKEEVLIKANLTVDSLGPILFFLQQFVSVMPDLKEPILVMTNNCQPLLNRPRVRPRESVQPNNAQPQQQQQQANQQQPPFVGPVRPTPRPGLPPSASIFPPGPVHDPLAGLANQLGSNLNLGSQQNTASNNSNSAFSLPNALGPLINAGGSPSRMFGGNLPPDSPSFNNLLQQQQQQQPSVSSSSSSMPPVSSSTGTLDQIRAGINNISNLFPDLNGPVSREVEDEANSYFQRIYNHPPHPTLTIDEVLELLKKFQESTNQRERDVFNCVIKNLFEEYKYFPQYPEKELHVTAQLFGGIIQHGLVTMIPLGLALRFVLDAVRKSPESKMYLFGIAALDRFKARLKDYPQYCQHVSCITHFKDFPTHLIEWVEFGAQSQVPPGKPQAPTISEPSAATVAVSATSAAAVIVVTTTATITAIAAPVVSKPHAASTTTSEASNAIVRPTASRLSIANTTNIDTLLNAREKTEALKIPVEKLQEKVSFIFNNLSLMNMTQKCNDIKDTLGETEYLGWLAQYLVMKRVSIEPNFHTLYANFLEALRNESLYKEVLKETYGNIKILLASDKSIANYSDRSLLKNLGHWLGLMTIARNIPILMVDLDLKPLVIEAFHSGQQELLYIVPFVAKVIESSAKSRVFKPPCPWTMGIMNLLAELHQEHDIKLNLKFEIEVLCKTLSLDLHILQPANLLKDYDKLNQILNVKSFGLKQPTPASGSVGSAGGSMARVENSFVTPQHPSVAAAMSTAGSRGMAAAAAAAAAAAVMGMDPMTTAMSVANMPSTASLPVMPGMPCIPPQPGAAGAGMGAALIATPQQQASPCGIPGQPFLPPGSGGQLLAPVNVSSMSMVGSSVSTGIEAGQSSQANLMRPVEPKFHFTDINTSNLNGIVPHISVDSRLTLLKDQPDLVQLIKIAIEKSIQEWAAPVIERANKIAVTTCEQVVKKDFALDHDENRLRQAAHHMVRNLTAGMAMITCRDHLLLSIKKHLTNYMVTLGRNLTPQQTEQVEVTVTVIANDNVELACAFIQKKAIEKAIAEVDKRLKQELEARMIARKEGRRYCDPVALAYQTKRMPDPICLKVGGVSHQQSAVYDEFARNIPGFKPLTERESAAIAPKPALQVASQALLPQQQAAQQQQQQQQPQPQQQQPAAIQHQTSEDCVAILDEVLSKVEPFVANCTALPATPHMANLHGLVDGLVVARNTKEAAHVIILVQKAVEALLEGLTPHQAPLETEALARYRDANLLVLRALADHRAYGQSWTTSRVTVALIEAREEIKFNLDAVDCLIRSGIVNLADYDKHLASAMASGEHQMATAFAMHLVKIYLLDDRSNAHMIESDLFTVIEALQKISTQSQRPPEGLANLMEMVRMSSERLEQGLAMTGPTAQLHSGIAQAREFEDPPGLLEKTEYLLREWVNAYHSRDAGKDSRQAFVIFVQLMNQHGILKTDDLITRFFRMSTQMCVDLCYRALGEPNNSPTLVRAKCFHTLDAYVRLITLLVKHSGETQNTVTKVNLLNKVLGIVAGVLLIDHDVRHTNFQQVPYHRIFIMLFLELNSPDAILENINFQVLTAYCNMLHILRPAKAPGFAFAWLEIVSHRVFLGRLLAQTAGQKGWPMYAQLMVDLFKFMSPFLRNAELAKPVHRLYRGTLRVLLVLLRDFPEFLCDYHFGFCDVIPPNCVQMRNLILSAFPRNMRLPDPFTPNLKVELLPEISIAPRTVSNYAAILKAAFKKDLDSYLKNRSPVAFLSEVRGSLQVANGDSMVSGNRYNIQLINALVMYVGTSAIQYIRTKGLTPNMSTIAHSSHMDIFQNLAVDLDTEGRYLFLNCIANQLRYPNSHTHYFSCTLLYLFAEANQESIQEQITRVLLERLIVNRPHPWGLLITFIELIKNPSYKFWTHEFVQCAPEIQKLFESVARSCMVHSVPRMDNALGAPVAQPNEGGGPQ